MRMLLLLIALLPNDCYAKSLDINSAKLIYSVARFYDLDAQELITIAYVESRWKTKASRSNKNGSFDVGMFQINSVHWSTTCKDLNVFTEAGNAFCAGRILYRLKKQYGDEDEDWIARYHSATASKKQIYNKL